MGRPRKTWAELTEAQRSDIRARSRVYETQRYDNDPEFRERKLARARNYIAEKRGDPEYRRAWNERQMLRARARKAALTDEERARLARERREALTDADRAAISERRKARYAALTDEQRAVVRAKRSEQYFKRKQRKKEQGEA